MRLCGAGNETREPATALPPGLGGVAVNEPPYASHRRHIRRTASADSRVSHRVRTGRDCLAWAKEDAVVGVDTDSSLVQLARTERSSRVPADFAGMDMMALGFRPGAFDGFLVEIYGGIPDAERVMALQGELARVLRPGGLGLVVAERKMYPCWWFLMPTTWPDPMVAWLRGQVSLDFRFSARDACEERLHYGLFSRCHTVESLSAELSRTFEVLSCRYQADPRYVLAAVRKREGAWDGDTGEKYTAVPADLSAMEGTLEDMEFLCRELERHAEEVASFFEDGGRGANCLAALRQSAEAVLPYLGRLFGQDSTGAAPSLAGEDGVALKRPGKGSGVMRLPAEETVPVRGATACGPSSGRGTGLSSSPASSWNCAAGTSSSSSPTARGSVSSTGSSRRGRAGYGPGGMPIHLGTQGRCGRRAWSAAPWPPSAAAGWFPSRAALRGA